VAFWAWYQEEPFLGNSTDSERPSPKASCCRLTACADATPLRACEPRVTEQFQPVPMRLPTQQFGGAAVDPLGMLTTQETPVVEKELQQGQVVGSEVAPQEKVVAQGDY